MKKAEIIETYNSLTPEILNLNEIYLLYTGREYTTCVNNMQPYMMSCNKDDLEMYLTNRRMTISQLRNKIEALKHIAEMKSTEEGINFLKSLEVKKKDLETKIEEIKEEFKSSFNLILHACGLYDWEMCGETVPSFRHTSIELHNAKVKGSEIHSEVSKRDGKWVMKLSAPCRGGCDITDRGDQYQWYKGYATICDNCGFFQNWMETNVQELAGLAYETTEELKKVEKTIEDPYEEYMKSKEN